MKQSPWLALGSKHLGQAGVIPRNNMNNNNKCKNRYCSITTYASHHTTYFHNIPPHFTTSLWGNVFILILQIRTSKPQSKLQSGRCMTGTKCPRTPNCALCTLLLGLCTRFSSHTWDQSPGSRLKLFSAKSQENETLGLYVRLFPNSSGGRLSFERLWLPFSFFWRLFYNFPHS